MKERSTSQRIVIAAIIVGAAIAVFVLATGYPPYETLMPIRYDLERSNFTAGGLTYYEFESTGVYDGLAHINVQFSIHQEGDLWNGQVRLNIWHTQDTSIESVGFSLSGYSGDTVRLYWEIPSQLKCIIEATHERPEAYRILFRELGVYGSGSFTQDLQAYLSSLPITINVEVDLSQGLRKKHLVYSQHFRV